MRVFFECDNECPVSLTHDLVVRSSKLHSHDSALIVMSHHRNSNSSNAQKDRE
jgi:hypothetical protein